jgi:hypothetical protein
LIGRKAGPEGAVLSLTLDNSRHWEE